MHWQNIGKQHQATTQSNNIRNKPQRLGRYINIYFLYRGLSFHDIKKIKINYVFVILKSIYLFRLIFCKH